MQNLETAPASTEATKKQQKRKSPRFVALVLYLLTVPFIWIKQNGRFMLLDEAQIEKNVTSYSQEPLPERRRLLRRFLRRRCDFKLKVKGPKRLRISSGKVPRGKKGKKHKAKRSDLQAGARTFSNLINLFSDKSVGLNTMGDILSGLVCSALRESFPDVMSSTAIKIASTPVVTVFETIANAVVTKTRWHRKHIRIRRKPSLRFTSGTVTGSHIWDFGYAEVTWKKQRAYAPIPYQDTMALLLYANRTQYKEAKPYFKDCFSLLIGCSVPQDYECEMLNLSSMKYDPNILKQFETHRYEVSALLDKWQRKRLKDPRWIDALSGSIRSESDGASSLLPLVSDKKNLRSRIRTAVLEDFIAYVREEGFLTEAETADWINGLSTLESDDEKILEKLFANSAQAIIHIMRQYVAAHGDDIVPEGLPASATAAKAGVWRTIGGKTQETFLMFSESDFASLYRRLAKEAGLSPVLPVNASDWLTQVLQNLREAGIIKCDGASYRFRYRLLDSWKDKDYVVALKRSTLIDDSEPN